MKNTIKKILKESYEHQYLDKICNTLTTGTNHESIMFMENMFLELSKMSLSSNPQKSIEVHQKIKTIYEKWKRDIMSNDKDKPKSGSMKGATADAQGDISNFYLTAIQDIICPVFMEMD